MSILLMATSHLCLLYRGTVSVGLATLHVFKRLAFLSHVLKYFSQSVIDFMIFFNAEI